MILGSFRYPQMAPIESPTRKISASDVNIFFSSLISCRTCKIVFLLLLETQGFCISTQKKPTTSAIFIVEVISYKKRFRFPQGELHSQNTFIILFFWQNVKKILNTLNIIPILYFSSSSFQIIRNYL